MIYVGVISAGGNGARAKARIGADEEQRQTEQSACYIERTHSWLTRCGKINWNAQRVTDHTNIEYSPLLIGYLLLKPLG